MLGSGAWDRSSKRKCVEGSFVSKNKSLKGKGKVCKKIPLGLDKQLEAELILGQEDSDEALVPPPSCQGPPKENFWKW